MKYFTIITLIIIVYITTINPSYGSLIGSASFIDIVSVTKDVAIWLAKAWNIIEDHIDYDIPPPLLQKTEKKLFARIDRINSALYQLSERIDVVGTNSTSILLKNLPGRVRFELRLNDLLDCLSSIEVYYNQMQQYLDNRGYIETATLKNYADVITSHHPNSIEHLLEKIYRFIVPSGRGITNTGILHVLSDTLKQKPYDLNYGLEHLESVWAYAYIYSDLRSIYALYETFRRFQNMQTGTGRIPSPKQAWIDLSMTILNDPRNGVEQAFQRIQESIDQNQLFTAVLKEVEGDMLCNINQSPQQVIYSLYNAIALTELKGYTMIQFAYMLRKLYGEGNFTTEAQLSRENYYKRTNNITNTVKDAMKLASKDLWRCDPKYHKKGDTYDEFTQLLQGYIQNEVDLNPDGSCRENCAEYQYTKSHGCYQNLYCRRQRRCNGKIVNCQFVDSDMWVCPSNDNEGKRRYEYVEYENGRVLGRKQGCRRGTIKVDSWWRWLFWHCSYCLCLCDEQGPLSDRFINLRASTSDINNNRVVTGLRFVKHNRIIHLQIQEGQLLPRGNIDNNTIRWVPVEDYKITDKNIFNGQDYHTLTYEKRALDLDDLTADNGHVVTGVRFKMIGSHINFEILTTPFDFETGKLIDPNNRSRYKDNDNTDSSIKNPRTEKKLKNPDIPIRSLSPSIPDSHHDQYIKFVNTDFDRDAAQTTVPFFDIQPVESLMPVPLIGAGIYHKGRDYFGGFVAPKIITYDFSDHLQSAFPEQEPEIN